MKIGIDAFGCDHARSGLGSYLLYFIANLQPSDEVQIELFGFEVDRYTYTSDKAFTYNSVSIPDTLRSERLWHKFHFKKFARKNNYDVILFPAAEKVIPCSFKGFKGIAVINSIISASLEENGKKYWHHLKKGLSRVQVIIAASQFIKDDLVKKGIRADKIQVIHNGIDHKAFFPMADIEEDAVTINPFSIKRPYFIYGSRLSGPGKKHEELIRAFTLFKKNTSLPHRLVIAGDDGACSEKIHKCAFESEAASDIFLTGYFPHESFPRLYAGADACIFPSVNEGVGLPVLEAMACGIPVLCSKGGALPEIGGDAPLYCNPDDTHAFAAALQRLAEDKELRAALVSRGLEWSARFSWEETVRKTLDAALIQHP